MRSKLLTAALMGVMALSPAIASPLGGDVGGLAGIINAKSKSLGVSIKIAKEKCETNTFQSCSYVVADGLWVIANSTPDKKSMDALLVYLSTGDVNVAAKYIVLLGVLMAIYAPEASEDERAAILKILVAGVGKRDKAEATLQGVQFKVSVQPSLGTFTTVSRP